MPVGSELLIKAVAKVVRRGVDMAFAGLVNDVDQMADDLWAAFPNPIKMWGVIFAFTSGLPGRILAIPFQGLEAYAHDAVAVAGLNHRVITVPQLIKLVFRIYSETVTNLTGTSETGLIEALAVATGRFMWQMWKRFSFLRKVVKWRSELDVINYYTGMIKKTGRIYSVLGFVVAVFSAMAWTGAVAFLIGLAISLLTGQFQNHLLSQNSRRRRVSVKGKIQRRFNIQKGDDP